MVSAIAVTILLSISVGVDILNVDVSDIREADWVGDNRPDINLKGLQGPKVAERIVEDVSDEAESAWFTLKVSYADGTNDEVSLNLKEVVENSGAEYYKLVQSDHKVYIKANYDDHQLDIAVQ